MKLNPFYRVPADDWILATNPDVAHARTRALENPLATEENIEEYVRQWVLKELLDVYGYPKEWLGERIVVEETVQMATMEKQADISIKNERGKTFLYVETKARGTSDTEFLKARRQLEGYLSSTHTAMVGMVTDGTPKRTLCLVKKVDPNEFDLIPDLPEYSSGSLRPRTRLVLELPKGHTGSRTTGLKPITNQYENVLFECHSAIRDTDGLHDDECLDELCKLIYAKIYDERHVLGQLEGTPFRFQIYGGNTEEVASTIRDLYEEAKNTDLELYAQRIPNYERSRGVFKNQIRLSSAALVRVIELIQNYSLVDTNTDIKGRAFQKVLGPAIRAGMGQYFTPHPVVQLAVGVARPTPKDLILDPFCGSGHFLTVSLDLIRQEYDGKIPERDMFEFAFFHLHGIEKSDRMVRIAMTDMLLHNDGHSNVRNTDCLLSFDNYPDIKALGGEENQKPEVFDIITTNPPFGSLLKEETVKYLGRFDLGVGRKSLPLEILGLERCFQFLKPGGKLLIVLPDGVLATSQMSFVRDWYLSQAHLIAVFSLPQITFTPFGAGTKTSLVAFQKKKATHKKKFVDTFYCKIENIGFDATGRSIAGSEIEQAIKAFEEQGGVDTMISYIVPNSILNVQDRHDERFFNRIDMMTIARLHDIADGDLCQLGCILENLNTGKGIPKEQQGTGDIAYLKVGNVARYRINFEGSESVSESALAEHKMEPLLPGDILISRVGTVGNACMYTETDPRATPSDNVLVLRLQKHDHIRPLYVCTFLNSPFGQAQIRRVTKQSLQEVVNQTGIKSIVIPNPSIEKQKEIEQLVADRLDRVAKLKAQIEREFTMADDTVRQALSWKDKSDLDAKPLDELMDIIKLVQDRAYDFSSKHEKAAAARRGRPKKEVGQPVMPGVRRPGRPRKAAAGGDLFV